MPFVPFDLERWQSTWETRVRFNLAESGVHGLSIRELLHLSGGDPDTLTALPMGYGQSDGTDTLRGHIAALYPNASPDDVTVTIGSSEANFLACWTLLRPGARIAMLTPAYMQIHGLARNLGAEVVNLWLRPERGWEPDPADIERVIAPRTSLVVVTDPNNPTGHVLSEETRRAVIRRSRDVGAWVLVDEVYQGAERNGRTTESWWGSYDRMVVVNGLSKAYGLPGLRIGWIVAPRELKAALMQRHDYTVIGPSPATDYLAQQALIARGAVLTRTRRILRDNYAVLERWLRERGDQLTFWEPACGAICLVRFPAALSGEELAERVRADHSILLAPGEHFLLPHHLRLGFGNVREELEEALGVLGPALDKLFDRR